MTQISCILTLCVVASIVPALTGKSVSYPGIGTFDSHDFFDPVHRPFTDLFLPQSPEHIDPVFSLYTRKNRQDQQRLTFNSTESIKLSNFNAALPTKVIVHGFIDNRMFGEWMSLLKDRFLEYDDYNVIVVDWSKGNGLPYGQASVNTRVTGAMLGIQIETICKTKNVTSASFHILGHSLGSHIAGYAGKHLKGALGHITGMDPAGPFFEGLKPEARLWHTDAQFVESVHTDARHLVEVGFGMYETCSHVDIFPNGGKNQPGCDQERVTSVILHGIAEGARRLVACNHQRSVDFYTDSLSQKTKAVPKAYECQSYDDFTAGKCTDCGPNGEKCVILGPKAIEYKNSVKDINQGVDSVNGKRFFLATSEHEPLFKFQYLIKIKMSDSGHGHFDQHGKIHLKFNNKNGNSENFDFNSQDNIFHLAQTYSHLLVLETDPVDINNVDFSWSHSALDILTAHIYVESIEVIGLSSATSTSKSAPIVVRYCNHESNQDIRNHVHTQFNKC